MKQKIKVLWFCNAEFSDTNPNSSGTWLHSMANALISTDSIHLYNITQGKVKDVLCQDSQSISQWLVPFEYLRSNGLPSLKTIQEIQRIIDDINPDIIHIWGTENYWGLLAARGYIKGNIILEIQGLKFASAKYFYSGLSLLDIFNCFGLKELIKPSVSLFGQWYSFKRWGHFEKEMLLNNMVISTQSDWVRAYVRNVNPLTKILYTSLALRTEFVEANKWSFDDCVPYQIFTSSSGMVSYKGLHILIDAIAVLKDRYPQVKLCIAGKVSTGLRRDGYTKWLIRKIKNLGLYENIFWLGSLDAENLVIQMLKANVVVIPSFIETYCVALDEALTVGVPTVISFSGAMPELATHEKSALYFPPGDSVMCAHAIERFFVDRDYAIEVSYNAFNEKKTKNNIALSQMEIYRSIIESTIANGIE